MYRTAPARGTPDTIVVCRSCGTRTKVVLDPSHDDLFTCASCGLEQPILRGADDLGLVNVRLLARTPTDAYVALDPLLRSLGSSGGATEVSIECDGVAIVVSLSINSGTVMGLDFVAPGVGLPAMRLVREDVTHREAKEKGHIREAQTGDIGFDAEVYIEAQVRDEDVRAVLAAPAVRVAVQKLLAITSTVRIEGGSVAIYVAKERQAFDPDAIRERLAWLRTVAGATRPIHHEDVPLSTAATVARLVSWSLMPLAIVVGFHGAIAYEPLAAGPYGIGALVGLALALAVYPILRRALAGRSTSHRDMVIARVATVVSLPILSAGLLFTYNGVMDRSPARAVVMKVVSTALDDDDSSKIHATAVDDRGDSHTYTFEAAIPTAPATVTATWRSGALGWTWESAPAVLTTH